MKDNKIYLHMIKNMLMTWLLGSFILFLSIVIEEKQIYGWVYSFSIFGIFLYMNYIGIYFFFLPWIVHKMVKRKWILEKMLVVSSIIATVCFFPLYQDGIGFYNIQMCRRLSASILLCCFFTYIHSKDLYHYYDQQEKEMS